MIVLDYLKRTHENAILVPPFHTGHLGLLPDTAVNVGLIILPSGGEHSELFITPYEYSVSEMAHVHCTMKDRPGVVQRLLNAISLLGINIELEESSAINRLNHHSVNLLVDWSSSSFPPHESTPLQRQRYSDWQSLFPLRDARCVRLFECIMAQCGHLIVWEEVGHTKLPRLFIRPLGAHHVRPHHSTKVQRDPSHPLQIRIPIPPEILGPLHNHLGTSPGDDLHYVLLSETEERVLRVFFPRPSLIPRILHLGFYHRDLPGALAAISTLLAGESFNILTSLLRKTSPDRSVWEVMLEYRGSDRIPGTTVEDQAAWVAQRLSSCDRLYELRGFAPYEFEVGGTLYPKRKSSSSRRIPIQGTSELADSSSTDRDIDDILLSRAKEARAALAGADAEVDRLLELVQAAIEKRKPSVFLSFPHYARAHARLVEESLKENYNVLIYDPRGAEVITEAVRDMISQADYFIGIWHHDDGLATDGGQFGISPWMPFEYGIATALGKPSMVVHSDRLDERIWKRINPGIANPEYKDLNFAKHTVGRIADYCHLNFR